MRGRWTKAEEAELRSLYASHTAEELAARFGTTKTAHNQTSFKQRQKKEPPHKIRLTPSQELWLRNNYPHISTAVCALILGVSHRTVSRRARALGLSKTETYRREAHAHGVELARQTALRNGSYPPKGYYSPNLQKGEAYRFKPGHKPVKPPF